MIPPDSKHAVYVEKQGWMTSSPRQAYGAVEPEAITVTGESWPAMES